MRFGHLPVALCALFAPAVASASEGGDGWSTLIFHAINMVLLLGLIIHFARKPIAVWLKSRAEGVTREIDEAKRLQREAQARLDEFESKLARLDAEAKSMLEDLHREGEAEKARIIEGAKQEVERIMRDAERAIENEAQRAKKRLVAELIDRAVDAAGELLRDKMKPDDRRRLTAEYLSQLEEQRSPPVGGAS